MYAKISSTNQVLIWPYKFLNLQEENPSTSFDDRMSIVDWYAITEDALLTQSKIVDVEVVTDSNIDSQTQKYILNDLPEFVDGKWLIRYVVVNKTEEELLIQQTLNT